MNSIFLAPSKMPCDPREIKLMRWGIPDTLGNEEFEEIAARLIHFSQIHKKWVGVHWQYFWETILNDHYLHVKASKKSENEPDNNQISRFWLFLRNTFPKFIGSSQERQLNKKQPFSLIYAHGPECLYRSIKEMVAERHLHVSSQLDENADFANVLFVTPQLIGQILEKQKGCTCVH